MVAPPNDEKKIRDMVALCEENGTGGPWTPAARYLLEQLDIVRRENAELLAQQKERLTFDALRIVNVKRCETAFRQGLHEWSPMEWAAATAGELGEAANIVKKLRRGDPNICIEEIGAELADLQTYLDLWAASLGIDLGEATVRKFNQVSDRKGTDIRLDVGATMRVDMRRYVCGACGVKEVKLWRQYLPRLAVTLRCANCAEGKTGSLLNLKEADTIGDLVPAIPVNDTFWGHAAAPEEGVKWWKSLPTRP